MTDETILTNAILVLPDATLHGTLVMRGDRIARVQSGRSSTLPAHDLDGDYLIAGIVDTHTDNLERQVQPRSLARWRRTVGKWRSCSGMCGRRGGTCWHRMRP